jgi:hypothetical protein
MDTAAAGGVWHRPHAGPPGGDVQVERHIQGEQRRRQGQGAQEGREPRERWQRRAHQHQHLALLQDPLHRPQRHHRAQQGQANSHRKRQRQKQQQRSRH